MCVRVFVCSLTVRVIHASLGAGAAATQAGPAAEAAARIRSTVAAVAVGLAATSVHRSHPNRVDAAVKEEKEEEAAVQWGSCRASQSIPHFSVD